MFKHIEASKFFNPWQPQMHLGTQSASASDGVLSPGGPQLVQHGRGTRELAWFQPQPPKSAAGATNFPVVLQKTSRQLWLGNQARS